MRKARTRLHSKSKKQAVDDDVDMVDHQYQEGDHVSDDLLEGPRTRQRLRPPSIATATAKPNDQAEGSHAKGTFDGERLSQESGGELTAKVVQEVRARNEVQAPTSDQVAAADASLAPLPQLKVRPLQLKSDTEAKGSDNDNVDQGTVTEDRDSAVPQQPSRPSPMPVQQPVGSVPPLPTT